MSLYAEEFKLIAFDLDLELVHLFAARYADGDEQEQKLEQKEENFPRPRIVL